MLTIEPSYRYTFSYLNCVSLMGNISKQAVTKRIIRTTFNIVFIITEH